MEKNLQYGEKLKNKVIQSEEFNVKERQCYDVSVLINHHQDLEKKSSNIYNLLPCIVFQ